MPVLRESRVDVHEDAIPGKVVLGSPRGYGITADDQRTRVSAQLPNMVVSESAQLIAAAVRPSLTESERRETVVDVTAGIIEVVNESFGEHAVVPARTIAGRHSADCGTAMISSITARPRSLVR